MPKLVTVLTPAYNAARYIGQAIESVQAQTHTQWRMVVIDDGSADNTAEIARRYSAADSRIEVYSQSNQGISATRNASLHRVSADSEYLFNLDADDLLEPTALADLTAYLDAHPKAGVVFCGATIIDGNGTRQGRRKTHRFALRGGMPIPVLRDGPVPFFNFYCGYGVGPFALLRRTAVEQAGEYNTRLFTCEDVDMFVRIGLQWEIHQIQKSLYLYRWHGANTSLYSDKNQNAMDAFQALWAARDDLTPAQQKLVREARWFHREWHPLILRGKFGIASIRDAMRERRPWPFVQATVRFSQVPLLMAGRSVRSLFHTT